MIIDLMVFFQHGQNHIEDQEIMRLEYNKL
jgi:hypothetical protein